MPAEILNDPRVKAAYEAFILDRNWANETRLANVIREVLLR